MTTSQCYISDLPDEIQEQLFDEGHYAPDDLDWPGQGEELLTNMYSDPKNTHTDFPCIWLEPETTQRVGTPSRILHWCWDEQFRVSRALIHFEIGAHNLDDAHRIFVEKLGLSGRQFLLLQAIQDDVETKMDRHGNPEVGILDGRIFVDDEGIEQCSDFVDDCFELGVDSYEVGPINPMFEETTIDDLYLIRGPQQIADIEDRREAFASDMRIVAEAIWAYVDEYLDHVQKALAAEHEHISSFEYWKDMAEANEWTVSLES